jgi:hypothetical protein
LAGGSHALVELPSNFLGLGHNPFTSSLFYRAFTQDMNPLLVFVRPSLRVFDRSFMATGTPGIGASHNHQAAKCQHLVFLSLQRDLY